MRERNGTGCCGDLRVGRVARGGGDGGSCSNGGVTRIVGEGGRGIEGGSERGGEVNRAMGGSSGEVSGEGSMTNERRRGSKNALRLDKNLADFDNSVSSCEEGGKVERRGAEGRRGIAGEEGVMLTEEREGEERDEEKEKTGNTCCRDEGRDVGRRRKEDGAN